MHSGLSDQLLPVQRSPHHTVLLPVPSRHHTIGESRWAARFLPLNTVLGLKLGKGRGEDCVSVLVNYGDITHRILPLHHPPPILMMPKSTA